MTTSNLHHLPLSLALEEAEDIDNFSFHKPPKNGREWKDGKQSNNKNRNRTTYEQQSNRNRRSHGS